MKVKASNVVFVLCACVNFGFPMTLTFALNAVFHDLMTSFHTDRGETATVQATCVGVMLGTGILSGMLERKLGPRRSMMIGSCLAVIGLFSGGFAPSLPVLVFTVGIVAGCGFSVLHLSSLSTALRRFPERAAVVSAVMACFGGTLHLGTPLFYRYLTEQYTWRGCLIIASGVALQTLIFGLVLTSPVLLKDVSSRSLSNNVTDKDREADAVAMTTIAKERDGPAGSRLLGQEEAELTQPLTAVIETDDLETEVTGAVTMETHEKDTAVHGGSQRVQKVIKFVEEDGLPPESGNTAFANQESRTFDSVSESETNQSKVKHTGELDGFPSTHGNLTAARLPAVSGEGDEGDSLSQKLRLLADTDKSAQSRHVVTEAEIRQTESSHWAFLKNPLYICVSLATVLSLSTTIGILILVVDFAVTNGWSVEDGVFFNLMFQLAGLVGRVVLALASLNRNVHSIALLAGSAAAGAVAVLLLGQIAQYEVAAALFSVMGAGMGGVVGMFPPAILSITGSACYPLALGFTCTVEGILDGFAGMLTGFLVDSLGSYRVPCLVYGLVSLSATTILIPVFRWKRKR